MTMTTNIQRNGNPANQKTNNMTKEGTMNHVNMVARISNFFRMENISKLIAGAAVGLALTIGVAMPGSTSAAVTNPGSVLLDNMSDNFSLVYGTPDARAKVKNNATFDVWNDDFSLVYGTPDAPAKVKNNATIDVWNDDFSLVYGTPDSIA